MCICLLILFSDEDFISGRQGRIGRMMHTRSCLHRTCGACKYTLILVVIVIIILLLALFLQPAIEEAKTNTSADAHNWVRTLLREWRAGALERGLTLAVGALVFLGMFLYFLISRSYISNYIIVASSTFERVNVIF